MYWAYTTVLFSRISDSANELTLLGINTTTQKHASQQGSLPLLLSTITMHISLILLQVLLLMSQSKKESGPKCMCLWEDCSRLSEEITEHAPEDHVWRGPFQRWRIRDLSDKTLFEKMLLLASMCHHVPGIADLVDSDRKQIILARHHFPIALYKRTISPKITTLLSDVQMGIVAESDVSDRL
jgi:hypothetical protein